MAEIASRVKVIIVDKLGVEESEVTNEASFTNDLGCLLYTSYIRLWDKFYSSCESLFLPQYEKKYFIFTDYPLKSSTNVQVSFQEDRCV